ncbi:hypothetical protein SKAU_G00316800 [Synaphobranchus kaupii]|uniref:Laminin G domain-containing protein n=1 Tax=Synaphobranchus kaupii TaxID=118154 RepID=A0A9Q1IKV1_SYNKA|nr:hypothetical protein SKAU_G00316800 [Synaphobranchus kaupii]
MERRPSAVWFVFVSGGSLFPAPFGPQITQLSSGCCWGQRAADVQRAVRAPSEITEKVVQLFKNKSEFTFLASVQQKSSTSGVILSIHESEHSYFELASNGLREEIQYHYRHRGKPHSESFPYRLADGQWHKIALSISASQLLLHVDCSRIYERVIGPPQMDLTPGSGVWLGQHSHKHGLFKVRPSA